MLLERRHDALPTRVDGAALNESDVFKNDDDGPRGPLTNRRVAIVPEDIARTRCRAERKGDLLLLGPARRTKTVGDM